MKNACVSGLLLSTVHNSSVVIIAVGGAVSDAVCAKDIMANEPPPQYGSDLAPAREPVPPPSNPAFSGTLHRAATAMEEWLLSTEAISEHTRVGTLARRSNNNDVYVRSFSVPVESRGAFIVRVRSFIARRHISSCQTVRLGPTERQEDS